MDKPEPIFADGVFFDRPREGAPSFIKGKMSIEPKKLIAFLEANKQYLSPKGWLNLDLKESKTGNLYFQVNTWKPLEKPEALLPSGRIASSMTNGIKYPETDIKADDIPF